MAMKINRLEIENVKRVKAVALHPAESGLTIIGGNNAQGKTSVLDSIAWALGGEKYRPSEPTREGSAIPPSLHIVMNNGLIVERKGKNSALKVTDPDGGKGGQKLLDEFVEELAINLPKFMESSGTEKAKTLLKIIGVGDRVEELERTEKEKYNERQAVGRIADQKEKYAKEQEFYPGVPDEPISAADLIKQQQDILARNGEKARIRANASETKRKMELAEQALSDAYAAAADAEKRLEKAKEEYSKAEDEMEVAFASAEDAGEDESTEELERNIQEVDEINRKVRANLDKEKAEEDARQYREQYNALTKEIEDARKAKKELLNSAALPLPGLSVEDGELTYNGQKWDCMSGSERLIVSTSIVRKLKPECGFVLLDKLEQMDLDTLKSFGEWLDAEGLQAIATRVSSGDECSIFIEDGYSVDKDGHRTAKTEADKPKKKTAKNSEKNTENAEKLQKSAPKWQDGVF